MTLAVITPGNVREEIQFCFGFFSIIPEQYINAAPKTTCGVVTHFSSGDDRGRALRIPAKGGRGEQGDTFYFDRPKRERSGG